MAGVEILLAERATRRWRVFHETYTICSLLDISGGETEWTYRGKLHSSKARGAMLMEPGEVHAMPHTIPPCNFRVLLIDPLLVQTAATELGMALPHWKAAHVTDRDLFQRLARLHASLEGAASQLERESRFVVCLRLLLERCAEMGPPSFERAERAILLRAQDFIREHHSRPNALNALSQITGLSRFHLVRAFTRQFGLPPHAYQIRVQAEKARTLLAAGLPPAMVAAQTGFADQSHLTRHFKAVYGATPGEYRRACGRSAPAAGARTF